MLGSWEDKLFAAYVDYSNVCGAKRHFLISHTTHTHTHTPTWYTYIYIYAPTEKEEQRRIWARTGSPQDLSIHLRGCATGENFLFGSTRFLHASILFFFSSFIRPPRKEHPIFGTLRHVRTRVDPSNLFCDHVDISHQQLRRRRRIDERERKTK